ncbi:hypothetical protein FSP39_010046 [Pinctada imbricata]|uniref:Uncharacterized protein n=1 Tax=Pinctada imbricata TaxID=66713 RepID=A0AA89BWQ9_PINIB|nr:hypothetical protein FSP39_010046 [Pinctada imbricata]
MSFQSAKLKPVPPEADNDKKSVIGEGERKGSISEKRKMSVSQKKPTGPINPKNIQSVTGSSLAGFMATKRFIKRFSQKNRDRSASSVNLPPKEMEPTYRMAPKKRFNVTDVEDLLKRTCGF